MVRRLLFPNWHEILQRITFNQEGLCYQVWLYMHIIPLCIIIFKLDQTLRMRNLLNMAQEIGTLMYRYPAQGSNIVSRYCT